jgi:hypothetical protein
LIDIKVQMHLAYKECNQNQLLAWLKSLQISIKIKHTFTSNGTLSQNFTNLGTFANTFTSFGTLLYTLSSLSTLSRIFTIFIIFLHVFGHFQEIKIEIWRFPALVKLV